MNMANIPKPKSMAARLVLQTAGIRIMVMSTTGESERTSAQIQRATRTTVAPKRPSTVLLSQPQVGALGHGHQTGDQPGRHAQGPQPIDPARGPEPVTRGRGGKWPPWPSPS